MRKEGVAVAGAVGAAGDASTGMEPGAGATGAAGDVPSGGGDKRPDEQNPLAAPVFPPLLGLFCEPEKRRGKRHG